MFSGEFPQGAGHSQSAACRSDRDVEKKKMEKTRWGIMARFVCGYGTGGRGPRPRVGQNRGPVPNRDSPAAGRLRERSGNASRLRLPSFEGRRT